MPDAIGLPDGASRSMLLGDAPRAFARRSPATAKPSLASGGRRGARSRIVGSDEREAPLGKRKPVASLSLRREAYRAAIPIAAASSSPTGPGSGTTAASASAGASAETWGAADGKTVPPKSSPAPEPTHSEPPTGNPAKLSSSIVPAMTVVPPVYVFEPENPPPQNFFLRRLSPSTAGEPEFSTHCGARRCGVFPAAILTPVIAALAKAAVFRRGFRFFSRSGTSCSQTT